MPFVISKKPFNEPESYKAGELRPIDLIEYDKGIKDFDKYFKIGGKVKKGTLTPIKRNVLDAFVLDELEASGNTNNLNNSILVFYHGYDRAKGKIVRGARVIVHSENCDSEGNWWLNQALVGEYALPSHEFVKTALEVTVAGWKNPVYKLKLIPSTFDWSTYQDDYFDNSRHLAPKDEPNPDFQPLTNGIDPKAVYFPYNDEIRQLATHNQVGANGKEMYFIISDFASYVENENTRVRVAGPNGYYHSLSVHTAYFSNYLLVQLLNDDNLVTAVNRGMDYGHLCPPRCDRAQLEQTCNNPKE